MPKKPEVLDQTHTGGGGPPLPDSSPVESEPNSGGKQAPLEQRERVTRRGSGTKRGPYKPRRGSNRPVGERHAEVKGKTLTGTLTILHDLISKIPMLECMALDATEAKLLGDALRDFSEEYPSVKLSNRVAVAVTLITACACIYGPRAVLIKMEFEARRLEKLKANAKKPTLTIVPRAEANLHDGEPGDIPPAAP